MVAVRHIGRVKPRVENLSSPLKGRIFLKGMPLVKPEPAVEPKPKPTPKPEEPKREPEREPRRLPDPLEEPGPRRREIEEPQD